MRGRFQQVMQITGILIGLASGAWSASSGLVHIKVVDEDGNVVPTASVYVSDTADSSQVKGHTLPGIGTLTIRGGDYRISAAYTKQIGDHWERFASHEAQLHMSDGEATSIILQLYQLDDPTPLVSYSEAGYLSINQ